LGVKTDEKSQSQMTSTGCGPKSLAIAFEIETV
jgi:hypothetical protein